MRPLLDESKSFLFIRNGKVVGASVAYHTILSTCNIPIGKDKTNFIIFFVRYLLEFFIKEVYSRLSTYIFLLSEAIYIFKHLI